MDLLPIKMEPKKILANVMGNLGDSPLHDACAWGNLEHILKLLEWGADLNSRNFSGKTPQDVFIEVHGRGEIDNMSECHQNFTKKHLSGFRMAKSKRKQIIGTVPNQSSKCFEDMDAVCRSFCLYVRFQGTSLRSSHGTYAAASWIPIYFSVQDAVYFSPSDLGGTFIEAGNRRFLKYIRDNDDILDQPPLAMDRNTPEASMDNRVTDPKADQAELGSSEENEEAKKNDGKELPEAGSQTAGLGTLKWINFPANNVRALPTSSSPKPLLTCY